MSYSHCQCNQFVSAGNISYWCCPFQILLYDLNTHNLYYLRSSCELSRTKSLREEYNFSLLASHRLPAKILVLVFLRRNHCKWHLREKCFKTMETLPVPAFDVLISPMAVFNAFHEETLKNRDSMLLSYHGTLIVTFIGCRISNDRWNLNGAEYFSWRRMISYQQQLLLLTL